MKWIADHPRENEMRMAGSFGLMMQALITGLMMMTPMPVNAAQQLFAACAFAIIYRYYHFKVSQEGGPTSVF